MDKMNVTIDEESLHTIARCQKANAGCSQSSDQCMSFAAAISPMMTSQYPGTADQDFYSGTEDILIKGLLHNINVFQTTARIQCLSGIRCIIKNSCCYPAAIRSLLDVAESTLKQLKNQAEKAGEGRLIRTIELLSPLESEMRYSTQPRVLLELAAVKLCRPEQEASLEALLDRVEYLEKKLGSGGMAASDAMIAPVTPST